MHERTKQTNQLPNQLFQEITDDCRWEIFSQKNVFLEVQCLSKNFITG